MGKKKVQKTKAKKPSYVIVLRPENQVRIRLNRKLNALRKRGEKVTITSFVCGLIKKAC